MPNLSAKELTALEEQLGSEQMLVKKYETFAQSCTDPTLKSQLERMAGLHQVHFNKLKTHLK